MLPALEHTWNLKDRELTRCLALQYAQVPKQFQNHSNDFLAIILWRNPGAYHLFPKENIEVQKGQSTIVRHQPSNRART